MISQSTIDKVRDLDILTIIRPYLELKKQGARFVGLSPFNDEKTPSFYVTPSRNMFKCFSSGHGGDGVAFVMLKNNLDFIPAVERICTDHGIPIEYEKLDPEQKEKMLQRADLLKLNEAAARQYTNQLIDIHQDNPANKMIFDRWTSPSLSAWENYETVLQLVIDWKLGYAPDSWNFLTKTINEFALNEQAEALGLVKKKKNGHYYDFFRHRLIFPIQDHNGRFVGFGGRALKDEKPKYLNSSDSSESEVFDKSSILYGLYQAQGQIRKQGFAYLTEGYTDVISMHLYSMCNTVASCGTSFTKQHAKLLKRYTDKVVILYDGDDTGKKRALDAMDLLLKYGFEVDMCILPDGHDPDTFCRVHGKQAEEQLARYQKGAILYKADILLTDAKPLQRNDLFNDIARSLALMTPVSRSDYGRKIAKAHRLDFSTMKQLIDSQLEILEKKKKKEKTVKKNRIMKLDGNATTWPFFEEEFDGRGNYKGIRINKVKFVSLLSSFGFTRYDVSENNEYNFVQLQENIINAVNTNQIIDHVVNFIENEYDYENADCGEHVNSEVLLNKLYDGMRSYFSKDLFARMTLDEPIIINEDDKEHTYLYYKNGFVTVSKAGWKLLPYEKMNGSVWSDQMLDREFKPLNEQFNIYTPLGELLNENGLRDTLGVFADFVYRISGSYRFQNEGKPEDQKKYLLRFFSLCSIIGYLIHDYYEYKLKAVLFTDSTLSDEADGRTGKTLLGKLIGEVRSYCEINGKNFDDSDKNKYSSATMGTQVLHINDVKTRGRNKFDFEQVFNDVTEGYIVDVKYMQPFKNFSKMIISTNKTLNISGGSQRDRIIQFEVSDFFNEKHSPLEFYGHWLIKEWDADEWTRFDNFMCYCSQIFHDKGVIEPSTINLELRVLLDHTCQEFVDFMNDIRACLREKKMPFDGYYDHVPMEGLQDIDFENFEFDKKKLYKRFITDYEDYQTNWFTQARFTTWLKMYSKYVLGVEKPINRRSNGKDLIIFKKE